MYKILVDTDILIDFSKGKDSQLMSLFELQTKGHVELYISPVNITEFLNDLLLSDSEKLKLATNFLEKFKVLKIGKKTGILAGQILRTKQTSYIGDALIGAVCIENEVELLTRNKKHFEKITGLKLN